MSIDTGQNSTYQPNYPVAGIDQSTEQFRTNFGIIKTAVERLQTATNTSGSVLSLTTAVQGDSTIKVTLSYPNNSLRLPLGNPTSPAAAGMIRYNTDTDLPEFYDGSVWTPVGTGSGGSGDYLPLTGGTVTGNVTVIGDVTVTGTVQAAFFDGYVESGGADLAERYATDAVYAAGTVVVFGGSAEITQCTTANDTRVAGVISTDPALGLNEEAGSDTSHPYVALIGRVPCKVVGVINQGDLLTTSTTPGHAQRALTPTLGAIVGKALEPHASLGTGTIEISVQRF